MYFKLLYIKIGVRSEAHVLCLYIEYAPAGEALVRRVERGEAQVEHVLRLGRALVRVQVIDVALGRVQQQRHRLPLVQLLHCVQ